MKPWFLAGSHPKDYTNGIDAAVIHEERKAAHLKCQADEPGGFGTLMQSFKADQYRNKRMRFSAAVKSQGVTGWAALWMRVDDEASKLLEFDNMEDRSIKGDTDWQRCQVVLDIPLGGSSVHFGVLLSGKGQVWLSDVRFEEAPDEPTTGKPELPDEPTNLDFSKE